MAVTNAYSSLSNAIYQVKIYQLNILWATGSIGLHRLGILQGCVLLFSFFFLITELCFVTKQQPERTRKSVLYTRFSHSQIIAWSLKSTPQLTWQI